MDVRADRSIGIARLRVVRSISFLKSDDPKRALEGSASGSKQPRRSLAKRSAKTNYVPGPPRGLLYRIVARKFNEQNYSSTDVEVPPEWQECRRARAPIGVGTGRVLTVEVGTRTQLILGESLGGETGAQPVFRTPNKNVRTRHAPRDVVSSHPTRGVRTPEGRKSFVCRSEPRSFRTTRATWPNSWPGQASRARRYWWTCVQMADDSPQRAPGTQTNKDVRPLP
jgi:hypothetical protein